MPSAKSGPAITLANQALRAYLRQSEGESALATVLARQVLVATRLEELGADVWPEEDTDDFLAYLRAERAQSLIDDAKRA